ncbi:MAG TPA: hypothetical protein VGK37_10880 [Casimicrobiaceae bacterium]|jgi:hypothetical protein
MKIALTLVAAVVLCGCSSLPQQRADNDADAKVVCNWAQMEAVDRADRAHFTDVRWFHCPQISRDRVKVS